MTTPQPSTTPERDILNAIIRTFGTRPDMRIWRMNTGATRTATGRVVRFGIVGQCDITGIYRDGRRIEIEVKSPTGRPSHDQQQYAAIIQRFNGIYVLARSVDDVYHALAAHGIPRHPLPLRATDTPPP